MIQKSKFIIGVVLLVVLVAIHFATGQKLLTLEQLQMSRLYLQKMIEQQYLISVALYIFIFVFATLLAIPITVLLTIAAGYFFGAFVGVLYANIGATLGASISLLFFRYLFGGFVQNRYGQQLKTFNQNIEKYGAHYLLTMQLLPVTPTLLINLFAGLTKIRFWTFVWTTSLGILPGSLIYTVAGRQFAHMESASDLLSMPMFILLVLLALLAFLPVVHARWGRLSY